MSVEAARRRLADSAPGYEEAVRRWATSLGRRSAGADRVRETLADVRDLMVVDVDVQTSDGNRVERLVKRTVKALIGWYLFYLARQVRALGEGLVRFGDALADRTDDLDDRLSRLERRVEQLDRPRGGVREG